MSIQFYQQLVDRLKDTPLVLATVVRVKGSVPREVGAKMMIWGNGSISGTIGGGAGEAKVIQQALLVLQTGIKQQVDIDLSGARGRDTQGICGGTMEVWLERWSGEWAIALAQQILTHLQAGRSVDLITPFTPTDHPQLSGSVPLATLPTDAFLETITPPPLLLIVGAGHVGIQLAKVADLAGFQIAVQDDRPDWANSTHYPQAKLIFTQTIAEAIAHVANHQQLYVALVTRGYQYDRTALQELCDRAIPCRYIGMIGSKKRIQQVYQDLEALGVDRSQLRSIHAPIGLDIGAQTPEEIAISIAAELIGVRRGSLGL
jgi:xanthine dehydrogenase accessory factor